LAALVCLIGSVFVLARLLLVSPAAHYRTITVTRGDIEDMVLATGILQPIRQVDVGTRVTGQLKSLRVKIGDHAKVGDLLAEIDPTLPQNELRAAQAHLDNLAAQRRASIAKARRSKLELERQRGMIKGATTSRRDLETAEAQALEDDASLAALDAQVIQAKSQVEIADANLGYTKIIAPIDGEVVGVLTQQGQTVVAAQIVPVILKLARLEAMTVRAQIPEAEVIHVKVGQPVSFTIMGDPDTPHTANIRAVELAPQNYSEPAQNLSVTTSAGATPTGGAAAVFYNALFDVPNTDRKLRIGMTAQVTITLSVKKSALIVPASVLRDQTADGFYALKVFGPDDRIYPRRIRIGVNNRVRAEVLEGLKEGDKIVIGQDLLSSEGEPGAGFHE
jgi:membrane fusion protein, macrolide-specific efflux system